MSRGGARRPIRDADRGRRQAGATGSPPCVDDQVRVVLRHRSAISTGCARWSGAHRVISGGETLSRISEACRASCPPPADPSTGTLCIHPRAATLVDAARLSSTIVQPHGVEIAFDSELA